MELGQPLPKRKALIAKVSKKPPEHTEPIKFQGQRLDLPRHIVPLGFAKYRLENGRTTDQQAQYIASNPDVGDDYFRRDSELDGAQKQQHIILTELAQEKALFRYFDKLKHKQEHPLVLSDNGIVINGNRRLCAWRGLYERDSKEFAHFAHIEVVFLPPCDPADLDEIEAELQVQDDIKAEYRWTARACMLREKKEVMGYSDNDLIRIYGLKKKELNDLLAILDDAEIYLEERGWPKQFSRVAKSEFAFRQLGNQRKKAKSEARKEVLEGASFALIDDPDDDEGVDEGRAYGAIKDLGEKLDYVIADLCDEFDIEVNPDEDEDTQLAKVIDEIYRDENRSKVREIIVNTIERERIYDRAKKKKGYVLTQIINANKALEIAAHAANSKAEKGDSAAILKEIEEKVGLLLNWANAKD